MNQQDLEKSLQEGSLAVRQAAEQLSAKLVSFTEWLSKLPGRVDTAYSFDSSFLYFKREGKSWSLKLAVGGKEARDISECTLMEKIKVVHILPEFMEALAVSQSALLNRLQDACMRLDAIYSKPEPGNERP